MFQNTAYFDTQWERASNFVLNKKKKNFLLNHPQALTKEGCWTHFPPVSLIHWRRQQFFIWRRTFLLLCISGLCSLDHGDTLIGGKSPQACSMQISTSLQRFIFYVLFWNATNLVQPHGWSCCNLRGVCWCEEKSMTHRLQTARHRSWWLSCMLPQHFTSSIIAPILRSLCWARWERERERKRNFWYAFQLKLHHYYSSLNLDQLSIEPSFWWRDCQRRNEFKAGFKSCVTRFEQLTHSSNVGCDSHQNVFSVLSLRKKFCWWISILFF